MNFSGSAETSAEMLKRVLVARDIAIGRSGHINSEMSPAEIKRLRWMPMRKHS